MYAKQCTTTMGLFRRLGSTRMMSMSPWRTRPVHTGFATVQVIVNSNNGERFVLSCHCAVHFLGC